MMWGLQDCGNTNNYFFIISSWWVVVVLLRQTSRGVVLEGQPTPTTSSSQPRLKDSLSTRERRQIARVDRYRLSELCVRESSSGRSCPPRLDGQGNRINLWTRRMWIVCRCWSCSVPECLDRTTLGEKKLRFFGHDTCLSPPATLTTTTFHRRRLLSLSLSSRGGGGAFIFVRQSHPHVRQTETETERTFLSQQECSEFERRQWLHVVGERGSSSSNTTILLWSQSNEWQ